MSWTWGSSSESESYAAPKAGCGCHYLETPGITEDEALRALMHDRAFSLLHRHGEFTWATLCYRVGAISTQAKTLLHQVLHEIAIPDVGPPDKTGPKSTRWRLR